MKIYLENSLTRQKEEFKPIKKNKLGLYTCGPTVYNYPHIGNLSAYVIWDVLKRFFVSQDYQVKHVMNLTDVGHLTSDADEGEDKMEAAKRRDKKTAWEVADYFIDVFKQNIKELNIIEPSKFLRATDTIKEQIDFVKILEEKGYLYKTSDGMYFDTSKFDDYGRLANLAEVDQQEGARVAKNPEKKNAADFAVWKFSPENSQRDMEWDSPWGKGFPGWHLECSVMSHKELGDTFDIHTGGVEHMTVHHPNEMAQSQAVTGKIQANYWLHNQHLRYEGGKMSKSAGIFIKLPDLEEKGYSPMAFRYFILQNNYRKPHNFFMGFMLTFPSEWQDYIVAETASSTTFGLEGDDDMFVVYPMTLAEWEDYQNQVPQYSHYIDENEDYVYVYSQGQDTLDSLIDEALLIDSIIDTFEFIED